MIQANELRIGNLVGYNEDGSGQGHAILSISESYIDTGYRKLLHIDLLFPIPITDEWVAKLGFSFDIINEGDSPVWQINGYDFYLDDKYQPIDCGFNMVYFEVKYVHELQNVYRWIKGEELTIKETV